MPFRFEDFSPRVRTRLLILQPTPFCNINCDYCYLPNRNSRARMTPETARKAAARLREAGLIGDELTVVWHAGEPLVMPPAFYEDAVAAIEGEIGGLGKISHSIQTNGTLLSEAWCDLFQRHSFRVGVSIDGPAELHDAHRRTRLGAGTHKRVMEGIQLLRARSIPFHVISVVTANALSRPDDFYDFFAGLGANEVGCNFDEAEGGYERSTMSGAEQAHAAFLERLLDRMCASVNPTRIRELAMAFHLVANSPPTYRWQGNEWPYNAQTIPFALVAVAHNGDFSTFSPELLDQPSGEFGNFVLGNVHTQSVAAAAAGETFSRLWTSVRRGVALCEKSCAHFAFCGGGAPANKLYENGDLASGETLYCRTMFKRPFDAVLNRLESQWSDTYEAPR